MSKHTSELIKKYAYSNIGPVVYEYTVWALGEARRLGIKRIYFLARDGYLPYQIACELCKSQFWEIEPQYLYCSRLSLRTPSYHLIGEEAFRLLTLKGYYVTPKMLLDRALITKEVQDVILRELKITDNDKPLDAGELNLLRGRLLKNETYKAEVMKISKDAYAPAIQYLREMGLFDNDRIAILDSGWSGSMQRSLRQIMESAGYRGKIYGFYFGMFDPPHEKRDGEYHTFYFNKSEGLLRKVNFNNNLFECMLSAPHPMTVGYAIENGRARPIFKTDTSTHMELVVSQAEGALRYVRDKCSLPFSALSKKYAVAKCYKILKRAMTRPTLSEAEAYSHFYFCDDVTEGYHAALSPSAAKQGLRCYLFVPRVLRRIFKRERSRPAFFWVYGAIAYLGRAERIWYRLNVFIWDFIKYLK